VECAGGGAGVAWRGVMDDSARRSGPPGWVATSDIEHRVDAQHRPVMWLVAPFGLIATILVLSPIASAPLGAQLLVLPFALLFLGLVVAQIFVAFGPEVWVGASGLGTRPLSRSEIAWVPWSEVRYSGVWIGRLLVVWRRGSGLVVREFRNPGSDR